MSKELIEIIKKRFKNPFHFKDLARYLNIKGKDRIKLFNNLQNLAKNDQLISLPDGYFALKGILKEILCKVSCHRDGYGFAIPLDEKSGDLFLPPNVLKDIYDGDTVWVRKKERKGKKPEGEIIRIEERGIKKIIGKIERYKGLTIVRPVDRRLFWPLILKSKDRANFNPGDYVTAVITKYPEKGFGEGEIEEILSGDSYEIELKNILVKLNLSEKYPEIAQKEAEILAKKIYSVSELERKDLTHIPFVTIDGERAKDFDDAVYLKKDKKGYRLFVAIADVSSFVKKDSHLDKEALFRGNSYYFPDRAVPMLPNILSDELCSLKPQVDRLSFVAEIFYSSDGVRKSCDFYLAKIRSRDRLTYNQVEDVLNEKESISKSTDSMLFLMRELTGILAEERDERGSIDFDLPEPEIIIGLNGRIEDIIRAKRLLSHRIIEEFMIAANRVVAEWFINREIPTIFRIHEPPSEEKLMNLSVFLRHLGYNKPLTSVTPKTFQSILKTFKGKGYERIVNTVVLRSMMQAKYSPEPKGHFGLAIDAYLHFTSPIRRYADLCVHRDLRNYYLLSKKINDKKRLYQHLLKICEQINKREREAFEAEREIYDFSCVNFMKQFIGDDFEGIISNITKNGVFVELKDYFIEGFISLEDMQDDYYIFDEERLRLVGKRKKKIYYIGKEVQVKLVKADTFTKRLYFALI